MNIKDVLIKEIKAMKHIKVSVIADAFEIKNIPMKVSSILFWEDRLSIDDEVVRV